MGRKTRKRERRYEEIVEDEVEDDQGQDLDEIMDQMELQYIDSVYDAHRNMQRFIRKECSPLCQNMTFRSVLNFSTTFFT